MPWADQSVADFMARHGTIWAIALAAAAGLQGPVHASAPQQLALALPIPYVGGRTAATATGYGVAVSREGVIVTAAHIVRACRTIAVAGDGNPPTVARLVFADLTNDVAALRAERGRWTAARLSDAETLSRLDPLWRLHAAHSDPRDSAEGRVRRVWISATSGPGGDSRMVALTGPVSPSGARSFQRGESGTPLLDGGGGIAAMFIGRPESRLRGGYLWRTGFALTGALIAQVLDAHSVAFDRGDAEAPVTAGERAEIARKVTTTVICHRG